MCLQLLIDNSPSRFSCSNAKSTPQSSNHWLTNNKIHKAGIQGSLWTFSMTWTAKLQFAKAFAFRVKNHRKEEKKM